MGIESGPGGSGIEMGASGGSSVLPGSLTGKVALVTGGSRGIGRAIAIRLAQAGAKIAINYHTNSDAAHEAADAIMATGGDCTEAVLVLTADVSVSSDVDKLVKAVLDEYGQIDILVNNAGITRDGLLMRMSEEDWDSVIDTNLKSCFLVSKAVLAGMVRQRSGSIVNVSSVVGRAGQAGQFNYAASKAGLIGATRSLAREVASRGIRVNAVAPGFIESDMTTKLLEDEKLRKGLLAMIPLNRVGSPADVANAVAFLCSDEASYITGTVLDVNGGLYMG